MGGLARNGLARIKSDNSIDAIVGTNYDYKGFVEALHLDQQDPNILYFGGTLLPTASIDSSGVFVSATGIVDLNSPKIIGEVTASTPDGSGGVYIAGSISWINGIPVGNIVHIMNDGTIDLTFLPTFSGSSWGYPYILSILKVNTTLFVGGDFLQINNQNRRNLASFDLTTKSLTAWNGDASDTVYDMVSNGTSLFIVGDFNTVKGISKTGLASIDISTGTVNTWDVTTPITEEIAHIEIFNDTLFVSGNFSTLDGVLKIRMAAVDITGASVLNWSFDTHIMSPIPPQIIIVNSKLIVLGTFSNINGQSKSGLMAVDPSTGTLLNWNPQQNIGFDFLGEINDSLVFTDFSLLNTTTGSLVNKQGRCLTCSIAFQTNTASALDGSRFFIGGKQNTFTNFNGSNLKSLNKLNTISGSIQNVNLDFNNPDCINLNESNIISIAELNQNLYVSGNYLIGWGYYSCINIIDKNTGSVLAGYSKFNDIIQKIEPTNNQVLVGGGFTSAMGVGRNYFTSIDLSAGSLSAWTPTLSQPLIDFVKDQNEIYVLTQNKILKYNQSSNVTLGTLLTTTGTFSKLNLLNNKLYIAGNFTNINGQSRSNIAAYDLTKNQLDSWNPNIQTSISSLFVNENSTYIGSSYNGMSSNIILNGITRNNLASLDLTTGSLDLNFNPNVNGKITQILSTGTSLYFAGDFTQIDGVSRNYLASFNTNTNSLESWNPNPNNKINALSKNNNTLFVGGDFTTISGAPKNYFSAFSLVTGATLNWNTTVNGQVNRLTVANNNLFLNGFFTNVNGSTRQYLAQLDGSNGSLMPFNIPAITLGYTLDHIYADSSHLYSYSFTDRSSSYGIGRFVITSATLDTNFFPNPEGIISSVYSQGSELYLIGGFNSISGHDDIKSIAVYDTTTGTLLNKTQSLPKFSVGQNSTLIKSNSANTTLYVTGVESINNNEPVSIFGFDLTTGSISFK